MRETGLQDFGPYKIVRQIAVGGMAEIYLARQRGVEGVERTVIIKRILERYAHDAEFVTMFLDEARLMAALSHPNIAQVFDVGHVDGSYFLAMEHVRGPTLGKLLAEAKSAGDAGLPRREALGIALAVAEALHYVHERRDELGRPLDIVHRDLNPSNVMVSYDGAVKLIDFGIAKAATKVYETRSGVVKGTYGYIAPEQLAGTTPVDRRADVFALGILLYEMCVGAHPYDVSDEPNLIDRILEARYRRPRQVRPDIPPDLDRLIASCLTPHPEGRPADMATLIEALAAHLGAHGMVPTQTAIAAVTRRLVRDEEGPRPLKRLTSPGIARPFGARARTGEATKPTRAPSPLDEGWTDPTVQIGGALKELSDEHPLGLPPDEAVPTRPRGIAAEDDEIPTTLMGMPEPDPAPRPRNRERIGDSATWIPPRSRPGAPSWVLAIIGVAGLLGAIAVTLVCIRLLAREPAVTAPSSPPPPAVVAQRPSAVSLRVVSEPPGAAVLVDGAPVEGQTPLSITLPVRTRHVWLRVSKAGFVDQEREVSAAVGEARFVLSALALDAGRR